MERKRTGIDDGPPLPHARVLERAYREIEEKYPNPMPTEGNYIHVYIRPFFKNLAASCILCLIPSV